MASASIVTRRLAAILIADVVGYSRLMERDEEGTLAALKALRSGLTDRKIEDRRGRIVKTMGDGLLVEFASIVDAVCCAVEMQREIATRNAGAHAERRIDMRVGIHLGDVIVEERDIFGTGVNIAARLEGLAQPGGICVSRAVREQVRGKLDFVFEDMGKRRVKNIDRPIHVFRVVVETAHAAPAAKPFPWWRGQRAIRLRVPTIAIFLGIVGSGVFLSTRPPSVVADGAYSAAAAIADVDPRADDPRLIGEPLMFESGTISLSEKAKATLDRQAAYLRERPDVAVTVEGYSSQTEDARKGEGVLADLRARRVRAALTERGVAATRIRTSAHGGGAAADGAEAQARRVLVVRRD